MLTATPQPGARGVTPSSGSRLPGIEGLRALAAGSIVVVHVWAYSAPDGVKLGSPRLADAISTLSAGVTLFFTLSGFLLYRPFAAAVAAGRGCPSVSHYLRNRVWRIAPAYWAILLIATFVLATVEVRQTSGALVTGRLSDPIRLVGAALLLQDFRPSTVLEGITPAWSLAVEAVFYCLLPLLALAVARGARRAAERARRVRLLLVPPVLLLILGLSGKEAAAHLLGGTPGSGYEATWHAVVERSFWAQADLFSFGMAFAVLYVEAEAGRLRLPVHWRRWAWFLAALVFLPCAATMDQDEHSYLLQNTGEALAITLALAALIMPRRPSERPSKILRILEARALVATGVCSYSLFLWHRPLIEWLRLHGLTENGWSGLALNLALTALVAGVLSALTYRWIERPALEHKRRSVAGAAAAAPAAAAAAVPVTAAATVAVAVPPAAAALAPGEATLRWRC